MQQLAKLLQAVKQLPALLTLACFLRLATLTGQQASVAQLVKLFQAEFKEAVTS